MRWAIIPIPLGFCAGSLASGSPAGFRPPTHSIERLRMLCKQMMLPAAILALSAAGLAPLARSVMAIQ